jgi:hypothetical protein
MDIIGALQKEEAKLHRQLTAVKGAITALNGGGTTAVSPGRISSPHGTSGKRTMSAAVRAKMSIPVENSPLYRSEIPHP